nr:MAG TPA: RNA polymerase Rpb1-like protein [Caudoviricetes sp.]
MLVVYLEWSLDYGSDFDGDNVLVIQNNDSKIKTVR